MAKKKTATADLEVANTKEVKDTPVDYSNYVSKTQFEALQDAYKSKCKEFDRLLEAYRAMALRYTSDGKLAKQFIKTAASGIDLLFPDDFIKGDN